MNHIHLTHVSIEKAIILTCLFLLSLAQHIHADTVKEDKARVAAQNWYRHFAPDNKKSATVARFSEYKHNERTAFYIYNFVQGGFVLVSANDAVTPVLGYGFDHSAPDEITNEAVKGWFDNYARQIDTAFVLNLKSIEMEEKWLDVLENRIPVKNGNSVGPLLTTTWDQGWPYNAMCPEDPNGPGGHTVAGCVAVAMSQIIKYWEHPTTGIGVSHYYGGAYGVIGANFNEAYYNYDSMPNVYLGINMGVAELLFHCGIASDSYFSANSTGSTIQAAHSGFIQRYSFTDSSIILDIDEFNEQIWIDTIKQNINNGIPLYYRGLGNSGGHAWVCDGYQESFLHFNWGWGGYCNGYFSVLSHDFLGDQAIISNLVPKNYSFNARFDIKKSINGNPFLIKIDNQSLGFPNNTFWDFGDGTYDTILNPIHLYQNYGIYSIKLIIGSGNNSDTLVKLISVPFGFSEIDLGNQINFIQADFDIADYNNDGEMDILASGIFYENYQEVFRTRIYNNLGNNTFSLDTNIMQFPLNLNKMGPVKWIDFDQDDDMDFFMHDDIFINTNNVFSKANFSLSGIDLNFVYKTPFFTDINNDAYLDILYGPNIYLNNSNSSFNLKQQLGFFNWGTYQWPGIMDFSDYDSDGDVDLLFWDHPFSKLYENNKGVFYEKTDLTNSDVTWGCRFFYSNDDRTPDIAVLAQSDGGGLKIYSNQIDTFPLSKVVINPNNSTIFNSYNFNLFDYNHDGREDILLGGSSETYLLNINNIEEIDTNFIYLNHGIPYPSLFVISDMNHDNKADLIVNSPPFTELRNFSSTSNLPPSPPIYLFDSVAGNKVFLKWTKGIDDHTLSNHLTYNLKIGNCPSCRNVINPMVDSIGTLKVSRKGNVFNDTIWHLKNLSPGTYYWSVQAIDNSFTGSIFSDTESFTIQPGNYQPEINSFIKDFWLNSKTFFTYSDFFSKFSDPESDSLRAIKFDSISTKGYFLLNGNPITVGQIIPYDQIKNLSYTPTSFEDHNCYWHASDGLNWSEDVAEMKILVKLFKEVPLAIPNEFSKFAWGDYNNDGRIDLLSNSGIFRNDTSGFENIGLSLSGDNDVLWFDADNDDDLDILCGNKIYYNDGISGFSLSSRSLPQLTSFSGVVSILDANNDNYLDILYSGNLVNNSNTNISIIYLNNGVGQFNDIINLEGLSFGASTVFDVNNNGQQDIVIDGINDSGNLKLNVYLNQNGIISLSNSPIFDAYTGASDWGAYLGSLEWGDHDLDGDHDLLLSGMVNGPSLRCVIYQNDSSSFVYKETSLFHVWNSSAKWIDLDSDGDLDVVLSGISGGTPHTRIYENANNEFVWKSQSGLFDLQESKIAIGDINNDGAPDLLLSGKDFYNNVFSKLYSNGYGTNVLYSNMVPTQPTGLSSIQVADSSISLSWYPSTDNSTPQNAITYNLYVGNSTNGTQIMSPMANLLNGYRKVVQRGNVDVNTTWVIKHLPPGTYYWSVQAIDNSFAGGPFAEEQTFTVEDYTLKRVSAKVLLEGAYNPGSLAMNNVLVANDLIPSTQPYITAPWNYTGEETVTSMPEGIIDWVLVELRQAASAELATEATIIEGWPKALLLKSDGSIVGVDNKNPLIGEAGITENLYIVIRHRNHLDVMSSAPLSLSGNTYSYDFTDAVTKAYGGAAGYKQIGSGVYGMVAGDIDADGAVGVTDFNLWALRFGLTNVFNAADADLDGQVGASDFNKWALNFGVQTLLNGIWQNTPYRSQVPVIK